MDEKDFIFTKNQDKLLSIATWAKYLAWVVFIAHIIRAALVPLYSQAYYQQMQRAMSSLQGSQSFWDIVMEKPAYYLIDIGSDIFSILLEGIIFYVVLKGISLGLNMIVETDINYREQKEYGGEL